jgi:hypothetical protein
MSNPVAALRSVRDGDLQFWALMFICPGCKEMSAESTGLHLLPVNSTTKNPAWEFDGNLAHPTLTPSILTRHGGNPEGVCHSFLKYGQFEYLSDCTHPLAGKYVAMVPLEDWMLKE